MTQHTVANNARIMLRRHTFQLYDSSVANAVTVCVTMLLRLLPLLLSLLLLSLSPLFLLLLQEAITTVSPNGVGVPVQRIMGVAPVLFLQRYCLSVHIVFPFQRRRKDALFDA